MTADLLALLDSDPAVGILAVADLREERAAALERTYPSPWWIGDGTTVPDCAITDVVCADLKHPLVIEVYRDAPWAELLTVHIAAEANPAYALAAVRRWRGVVERHRYTDGLRAWDGNAVPGCAGCGSDEWPCPDIRETADESRAYLGGAP